MILLAAELVISKQQISYFHLLTLLHRCYYIYTSILQELPHEYELIVFPKTAYILWQSLKESRVFCKFPLRLVLGKTRYGYMDPPKAKGASAKLGLAQPLVSNHRFGCPREIMPIGRSPFRGQPLPKRESIGLVRPPADIMWREALAWLAEPVRHY